MDRAAVLGRVETRHGNVAAAKKIAATTIAACSLTDATRIPPSSGPTNVPKASPRLDTTLPATSSSGSRARDGSKADWTGRTMVPAAVTTAAAMNTTAVGAPIATLTAQPSAPSVRSTLAATRTRPLPNLAAGMPASVPVRVAGTIRTRPRMPTASGPPARYATTRSATSRTQSPAIPPV